MIKTHARIITATSRILEDEIRLHRFRDDLYYRLNVIPITLPPLRNRMQDIPLLARHFLRQFRQSMNHNVRDFSPEAVEKLAAYSWPGNIRELRNIVERTLVLHSHQELILPSHLPEFIQTRPISASPARREGLDLESAVSACERELILNALRETKGNQSRAARLLGTTRRILRYKMDKLSLSATS